MKKKYENKEMSDSEELNKQPGIDSEAPKEKVGGEDIKTEPTPPQIESREARKPSEAGVGGKICIRECDMPFVGSFKAGQVVTDPQLLEKIGDNPNFVTREG